MDGIFTCTVGQFEVSTLVEVERDGDVSIIPDASKEILSRYIPAEGFKSAINIFL